MSSWKMKKIETFDYVCISTNFDYRCIVQWEKMGCEFVILDKTTANVVTNKKEKKENKEEKYNSYLLDSTKSFQESKALNIPAFIYDCTNVHWCVDVSNDKYIEMEESEEHTKVDIEDVKMIMDALNEKDKKRSFVAYKCKEYSDAFQCVEELSKLNYCASFGISSLISQHYYQNANTKNNILFLIFDAESG